MTAAAVLLKVATLVRSQRLAARAITSDETTAVAKAAAEASTPPQPQMTVRPRANEARPTYSTVALVLGRTKRCLYLEARASVDDSPSL